MRRLVVPFLAAMALLSVLATSCGSDRPTGGAAIKGGDSTIGQLTAEGLFQRGENEASVKAKLAAGSLSYRQVEVSEFLGGSLRVVRVTTDANQPFTAYIFLPIAAGGTGTMVVVNRQTDIVEAVLAWDCSSTQIFLRNGGITDFENEFCKASAAG
jgi:hypothetical protein